MQYANIIFYNIWGIQGQFYLIIFTYDNTVLKEWLLTTKLKIYAAYLNIKLLIPHRYSRNTQKTE